jgi:hypothetical protein
VAKQSGLGDNLYVGGYNISGDIGSLGTIGGGPAEQVVTGIDKSAPERIGGLRNGTIEFSAWFNDATGREHPALSALPTTDRIITYCRGTAVGSPAAAMVAKQINYDPSRAADGALSESVSAQSNGYGIEWGRQLTAGVRTDTGATNGASLDTLASASFGGQAYLHVFSFAGTDVTILIQDSANNTDWLDVASFAFTEVTAGPTTERIALGNTATIRRYVRVITETTGGFTSCAFAVAMVKNEIAGQVF